MIRLGLYYALLVSAVLVARFRWPDLYVLMARTKLEDAVGASGALGFVSPRIVDAFTTYPGLTTAVAIVGALVVMLPVAWVYMITKQGRGYDQSVVHTLIVLPVAICGVVVIVRNSVALAFSLAGIVAAVRFRNTLKDTKDAVYIFVAIGVGLSAGVQNLEVAGVVSIMFNLIILGLWWTNFGNVYADQRGRTSPITAGQAVAGSGAGEVYALGDPELLEAMNPTQLDEVADRAQRFREHVAARTDDDKKKRPNAVVVVHASSAEQAEGGIEDVLENFTKSWKLVEVAEGESGRWMLEYLVCAKKSVAPSGLLAQIKRAGAPHVLAAEFRSLKGLNK
ncbi:MAG: DUF4956 domain-containing protein [Gemmatimonadales bacterium]